MGLTLSVLGLFPPLCWAHFSHFWQGWEKNSQKSTRAYINILLLSLHAVLVWLQEKNKFRPFWVLCLVTWPRRPSWISNLGGKFFFQKFLKNINQRKKNTFTAEIRRQVCILPKTSVYFILLCFTVPQEAHIYLHHPPGRRPPKVWKCDPWPPKVTKLHCTASRDTF